jgi:hypothetical protein
MSELATVKTIVSYSWPMRWGIVKMQYWPCGTCSTPAMQDLGKWLEYFFAEVAIAELFRGREPILNMAPSMLMNTVSIAFWAVIVCGTLIGASSADPPHIS